MSVSSYDPAFDPPFEPVTPPDSERNLRRIQDDLEINEKALTGAADEELEAQGALDDADTRWRLDPECPQAGVFNGVRITVAYVNAWVRDKTAPEHAALRVATQKRKAAEAQRRRLEGQLRAAQSINSSVRESYRGTAGRW